jgi:hypothetical protein
MPLLGALLWGHQAYETLGDSGDIHQQLSFVCNRRERGTKEKSRSDAAFFCNN